MGWGEWLWNPRSRSDRARVCEVRTGPACAALEDADRAHKPRNVGSLQQPEEAKTWILGLFFFFPFSAANRSLETGNSNETYSSQFWSLGNARPRCWRLARAFLLHLDVVQAKRGETKQVCVLRSHLVSGGPPPHGLI